jgi:hypothetical protein
MAVKAEKAVKAAEPEKATEPEKVPEKKKEAPKAKASFFMYLGPTILGVIQNASIYTADEVGKLDAAIEKYPRIKALLISDKTIAEDRINVTKPGTRLYAEYHRLVNELKK